jgi:hypothetical protein
VKIIFKAVLLIACSTAHAGEPSVRDASLVKLRDAFSYATPENAPASTEAEPLKAYDDSDVIRLERYVVSASLERLDLVRDFEHKAAVKAEKAFSLEKGGLIRTKVIGKVEVEMGIWTSIVPSKFPGGMPILRIDILHLRW